MLTHIQKSGNKSRKTPMILEDILYCIALAGKAMMQDEFSLCFQQKEEKKEITFKYCLSVMARYGVLLPIRMVSVVAVLLVFSVLILFSFSVCGGRLSNGLVCVGCRSLLWCMGIRVKNYGVKTRMNTPHVYVSNHTTYLDYLVLSSYKFSHAVIAQKQNGVMSMLLKLVSGAVEFERGIKTDRNYVREKIRNISKTKSVLIFPEGTCVNNEYTVMFQKGAFDMDVPVCPVAIKYNKSLGDPYWNTRKQTFTKHFFYIITRWHSEVSVWWMAPLARGPNETAAEFATRTKKRISEKAGLKNLIWNGYLKHCTSPEEMKAMTLYGTLTNSQSTMQLSHQSPN
ncbi:glycerol-3-phosphate O-acyltransferase 3/4 [Nematocida sp. AWRm80]|nr:glycerol-3-phosphate O-acyltransferase 3/4 [Nematocida sp. AWRm80]